MFAIQSLNQGVLQLSQLPGVSVKTWRVSSKTNSSRPQADINILCSESFFHALKNLRHFNNDVLTKDFPDIKFGPTSHSSLLLFVDNVSLEFLRKTKYDGSVSREITNDLKMLFKNNSSTHKKSWKAVSSQGKNQWQTSYVSASSFDSNKQNMLCMNQVNDSSIWSRPVDTSGLHHLSLGGCRTFKTDRNLEAEFIRNPTLWARFQRLLGFNLVSKDISSTVASPSLKILTQDLSKIKNLTTDESLTEDERQRVKLAFAEGYLAHSQQAPGSTFKWLKAIQHVLTLALFIGLLYAIMASASGSMFRFQLGNQTEVDPEEIRVTFDDVKGADEAKQELKDVVEFLKNPEKFSTLGAKLPKGVLLVGLPGTGKTLLARAVAGEAGVPFFHAAGPEFDEILVGQGARRVRDLFKAAKDRAPCVIFIDEIDSVGSKRTNSVLHPYANQTINQLLTEMDGFRPNEGVIVLGATNRRDDLDKALLRPGRFDVEVNVPTPDYTGRKDILKLYLSKILCKEVDVNLLARGTTGFTGADLENMVNQAAIRAAFDGASHVTMKHLDIARDKVLMGPERKSRLPDDEENLITAYHEGGHAIVAYFTKDSDALHKVTIMPRGPSLGHTAYIPEKESYHVTKSKLLAIMDTLMGGRAAEELIFGSEKVTSGASSDLTRATSIATHMVKEWGMSEKVGLRTHESKTTAFVAINELGQTTNDLIDAEIKRIMQESYDRAKTILKTHAKEHKLIAEALMKYETLSADDIKAIITDKGLTDKKSNV